MITVKVKTLDSQNHEFSVDEEISVKQFKEHIADKVNITADLQRLIYCGRVLNDEKPLKEYDVNGKCLHLVQRCPPSSNGSSTSSNDNFGTRNVTARPVNMGDIDLENIMTMGSFSIPVSGNMVGPHTTTSLNPSSTLCGNRITVARHMLQCADNIAGFLENPAVGLNNQNMDLLAQQTMESTVLEVGISAVTDADLPQQDVQNIVQAFQGAVSAAFRQNGINNITVQQNDATPGIQVVGSIPSGAQPSTTSASSSITIEFPSHNSASAEPSSDPRSPNAQAAQPNSAANRQQTTSTHTLGEVVGQMRTVQMRLDPFVQQYYDILTNDPTYADDAARENAQRVFDRVAEALHYMSHAQHAISDLMLDLNLQTPRHLCCRPILVEQSAFVSSGISAPTAVGVGSINIGPIFARGNMSGANNNNNQPSGQNNTDTFTTTLLNAFGLGVPASQQPVNSTNTTATSTTASAGSNNQSSQAGQPNRNRVNVIRNQNFLQRLTQENADNLNAQLNAQLQSNESSARASEGSADPAQARVNSNTQPTTSTQTRSTSRPILTSTTLPPTSIRNFRPIPSNMLSSFDRFLPCNSHHIRDNNLNQQQQNQQTQTIHIRPVRRAVSLDRNSMRQSGVNLNVTPRSQQTPPTRNQRMNDSASNISEEELNHRFSLFGIQFSIRDLEPSFYNSQRSELRSFLRQSYFNNGDVNEATVTTAIRDILREMEVYLGRLADFTHPDYDVRKSIENLIIKSLPFIIHLITDDESSEFGTRIERQLITFCENVYMILVKCIGVRDTEKYLNEIANEVINERAGSVGNLTRFPRFIIQRFLIDRRSYDLSEIQEFLVVKRPSAPMPAASAPESDAMDVDEVVTAMVVETEDDVVGNIQNEDLSQDPLLPIDRAEPWHAQFSSSWLPIIHRDLIRQQRQTPQRPYSDVYISGMSSKRRKILQARRPSSTVQQLVAENVRQVLPPAKKTLPSASSSSRSSPSADEIIGAISSDPAVLSACRDEIKSTVGQRLKSDPDKDGEKHPNSSKAFK